MVMTDKREAAVETSLLLKPSIKKEEKQMKSSSMYLKCRISHNLFDKNSLDERIEFGKKLV